MQKRRVASCFIIGLAAAALGTQARASVLADSVNDTFSADNAAYWGLDDVGWLYTPASSYSLTGINTFFSIPNGTSIQNRTVTTVIYQDNTPTNGGTLLGSFSWDSTLAQGQLGGGSFSTPIPLTSGQQYFVGFENVGPMNPTPNVDDLGVNFTADSSATSLSGTFYDVVGNATCPAADTFACEDANMDFLSQPILQFFTQPASTTPEPGSGALLAGALGLALLYSLRLRSSSTMKP